MHSVLNQPLIPSVLFSKSYTNTYIYTNIHTSTTATTNSSTDRLNPFLNYGIYRLVAWKGFMVSVWIYLILFILIIKVLFTTKFCSEPQYTKQMKVDILATAWKATWKSTSQVSPILIPPTKKHSTEAQSFHILINSHFIIVHFQL